MGLIFMRMVIMWHNFDSFGVEPTPKEIKTFIENKNIAANLLKIKSYDLKMCGYFCIGFIDFKFKGISLLEYTNLFCPSEYEKNDKIILTFFQ